MATDTSKKAESVVNMINTNTTDNDKKIAEEEEAKALKSSSNYDSKENGSNNTRTANLKDLTKIGDTEASASEQSITINDPVKVTITVVQSASEDKAQEQVPSSSSRITTEKDNDTTKLEKSGASALEQSITINDPVKVTINVVQDSQEDKLSETTLSSLSSSQKAQTKTDEIDDSEKSEKLEKSRSEKSSEELDPTAISSIISPTTVDKEVREEFSSVLSTPTTAEDKTELKEINASIQQTDTTTSVLKSSPTPIDAGSSVDNTTTENILGTLKENEKVEASAPTATTPAKYEKMKDEEMTTDGASVDQKKESERLLASSIPTADKSKIVEKTTADDDLTVEKEESDTVLISAAPSSEQNKKLEETIATPSTTETTKEETKPQAPELTSTAPTTEKNMKMQEMTRTDASAKQDKISEPTTAIPVPNSSDDKKKTLETSILTTDASNEESKDEASVSSSEVVSAADNEKVEETKAYDFPDEETEESQPVLGTSSTAVEGDKEIEEIKSSVVSPDSSANDNTKKEVPSALLATSLSKTDKMGEDINDFPIVKDNLKNLTDFQRKKAEYFFNVNLGTLYFFNLTVRIQF